MAEHSLTAGNGSSADAAVNASPGPTDIRDPLLRHEAKRAFVWIGMISLVALAVFLSQSLLVIFGGMVIAALVDGGARLLGRVTRLGRGWRVAIVLILTVLFFIWLGYFAGSSIAEQAAALPQTVRAQATRGLEWLHSKGLGVAVPDVQTVIQEAIGSIGQVTRVVGGIIGGLGTLLLVLVLGVYFAIEPQLYQRGVAWMLPRDQRPFFEDTAKQMGTALRRLLYGRLLGMMAEGVATWLLLLAYGVPSAVLLGLITGLLAFLPNLGAPISGAIMVLVGFSGGVDMGIYTIIVYLIVQTVDGYIIVPMIARRTVDLPPALVLGAQLIMGVLFGILGLVLADPLVVMIKVWLQRRAERNEELARLAR